MTISELTRHWDGTTPLRAEIEGRLTIAMVSREAWLEENIDGPAAPPGRLLLAMDDPVYTFLDRLRIPIATGARAGQEPRQRYQASVVGTVRAPDRTGCLGALGDIQWVELFFLDDFSCRVPLL